jgi:hypothetical protein
MEAAVAHIRDPLPGAVNARINGRLRCMQPAGLPVGRGQPESAPEREDDLRGGSVGRVRDDAASPLPHPLSSCALRFGDLVFVLQARRVDEKAFARPVDCPKAGGAVLSGLRPHEDHSISILCNGDLAGHSETEPLGARQLTRQLRKRARNRVGRHAVSLARWPSCCPNASTQLECRSQSGPDLL